MRKPRKDKGTKRPIKHVPTQKPGEHITWLTARQVAEELEISEARVHQLVSAGRLWATLEWGRTFITRNSVQMEKMHRLLLKAKRDLSKYPKLSESDRPRPGQPGEPGEAA